MTNVLIVEDQELVLELLSEAVNRSERYRVVHTTKNADVAPALCSLGEIDLVLMDVCTEFDASGLDAARRIKQNRPEIKIIIITSIPEASWMDRAREIGVESFWYKRASRELLDIMDRTMAGQCVYPDAGPSVRLGNAAVGDFSAREIEVLRELTTGAGNREIAARLFISEDTVAFHIKRLLKKTGLQNRTELAVEARRLGVVMKLRQDENYQNG